MCVNSYGYVHGPVLVLSVFIVGVVVESEVVLVHLVLGSGHRGHSGNLLTNELQHSQKCLFSSRESLECKYSCHQQSVKGSNIL